jgi:cysteine desulfurase / selenocysteine lyase
VSEIDDDDDDDQLKHDFPITKKTIYMNNGAIAPTPLSTIKAMTDFMLTCAEAGPFATATFDYITSLLDELRTRIAHLINCEHDEVVFVQSTTEGLNIVANGLDWRARDAIVVRGGRHEHYANYLPWVALSQKKGVQLRELAMTNEDGYFDLGELEKLIKGSRLITMSHVLYNTGAIMPVEEVGGIVQENGDDDVLFCVDAAQSAGTIPVDVKKIGCDFMSFPGFKWLCGPTGIGVFYCSKKAFERLTPLVIGGESATLSDQNILAHLDMPDRFQGGFRNFPGAAGLEASLRYILRIGLERIRKKNMNVAGIFREEIAKIPVVKMYGPDDESKRSSIVTFMPQAADSSTLVKKLEQNSIIFAARDIGGGKKAVRAAPHFFNSEEEASTAASYIKSLL